MLRYIFSTYLLLFAVLPKTIAQNKTNDSLITNTYGLRIGCDLNKITRSLLEKDYKGFEITADYRVSKKNYIATEIGTETKTTIDPRLQFITKGNYVKVGFDTNFYQNWLNMENLIHLGLRYGMSNHTQQLTQYKLYDTSNYFDKTVITSKQSAVTNLNAHWLEVVGGVKAKLWNNFYAGISLRIHYLIHQKKPDNFDNLYIPGFNRTYNGNFGAGWNYTLSYLIPISIKQKENK